MFGHTGMAVKARLSASLFAYFFQGANFRITRAEACHIELVPHDQLAAPYTDATCIRQYECCCG
jgi:hypothetical protein